MLTKNDLQQIKGVVQDAVEDAVKGFVTKTDLQVAMKDFVTKADLKLEFEAQAVLLKQSFQEVQDQMNGTNARIDSVHNAVDGFLGKITKLEDEYHVIVKQMKRWDEFYPLPQT